MRHSHLGLLLGLSLVACGDKEEELTAPVSINSPPVADAGGDQNLTTDEPLNLDGGASFDPDGDMLRFTWAFDSIPAGSEFTAGHAFPGNGTTNAQTTFTPDATGTYIVSLVVTDTQDNVSAPDFVVINVVEGNLPVADAGADLSGAEGDNFILDGSGSFDPTGRELDYDWTFQTVPPASALTALQNNGVTAGFTADVGGRYVVSLIVDNGVSRSAADSVVVEVSSNNPLDPEAEAGEPFEGEDCTAHDVDGSASYDPNGDALQYRWSLHSRPADSNATHDNFADRNVAQTTFYPDAAGDYELALSVYDGTNWSSPDLVTLTATDRVANTPPVVVAGEPMAFDGGEAECTEVGYSYRCVNCTSTSTTLGSDASVSDADGDPVTTEWTIITGTADIREPNMVTSAVVLEDAEPTAPGACETNEFQFRLTATDCTGATVTSDVVYTVQCCGVEPAAE